MMHFLVDQEQSLPSQAWVQAQASAIAGDGGVAQAGAQGPPNNFLIFNFHIPHMKYRINSNLPNILRICVCGSWRSSCCHCHGDSQGKNTSSIILDLLPSNIPL